MATKEINQRQHLIIKCLKRQPMSYREIFNYLSRESEIRDNNLLCSIRTFKRDISDIADVYGIYIGYNPSLKAYEIIEEESHESDNRIIEAFDFIDSFELIKQNKDYVMFDNRRASGTDCLYLILSALKKQKIVKFNYKKFHEDSPSQKEVAPLAIKEFKNRWYLIGADVNTGEILT